MNTTILKALYSAAAVAIVSASAGASAETQHQIGVSTYALKADAGTVSAGNQSADLSVEASGAALMYTAIFSNNTAARVAYYNTSIDAIGNTAFNSGDVDGFDLSLLLGTNLQIEGFKAYIAPGFYSETASVNGFERDFSGLQLGGGIGYNWERVSVDFWANWRDSKDYDNFIGELAPAFADEVSTNVISGGLSASLRF